MVSLVLGIMGFIFLLTGIIIFRGGSCSTEGYIAATARLETWLPAGSLNQVKPFVVFSVDGKEESHSCQLVNLKRLKAKPGDTVEIYYRIKKTLGVKSWNVLLNTDDNALERHVMVPRFAAVLMLGIGIVLLLAVVILLVKGF